MPNLPHTAQPQLVPSDAALKPVLPEAKFSCSCCSSLKSLKREKGRAHRRRRENKQRWAVMIQGTSMTKKGEFPEIKEELNAQCKVIITFHIVAALSLFLSLF